MLIFSIINFMNWIGQKLKVFLYDLFDIISFIIFVWGIVLFIRFFIINPFTVLWQSMEPTFHEKDFILIDKLTHRYNDYKRGDVIVFVPDKKDTPYIKRVIGISWDTVKINDDWVYRCQSSLSWDSCEKLVEPYLPAWAVTKAECWKNEFFVTSWNLFVMWDNREHSTDSRCCFSYWCYTGSNYLVWPQDIVWKVLLRVYPQPQNKF